MRARVLAAWSERAAAAAASPAEGERGSDEAVCQGSDLVKLEQASPDFF
jgi:hypothetical protein